MKIELDILHYKIMVFALQKLAEDIHYRGHRDQYSAIANKVSELVLYEEMNPNQSCDVCFAYSEVYNQCGKLKICKNCIENTFTFRSVEKRIKELEKDYELLREKYALENLDKQIKELKENKELNSDKCRHLFEKRCELSLNHYENANDLLKCIKCNKILLRKEL